MLEGIVLDHEPEPIDDNAVEALLDPEYVRGMRVYDEAYQSLADDIWRRHYLRPEDANGGRVKPLPEVPPDTGAP